MAAFVGLPQVESVIAHGTTKSSVRLENGLQIDLRCVESFQFPYVLHHFTGSKEHNVAMRQRALRLGLKMNEYGLFRVGKGEEEVLIECADETELFSALGWISYRPSCVRIVEKLPRPRSIACRRWSSPVIFTVRFMCIPSGVTGQHS
ncbi:MAG: hypothetical protein ACOX52_21280 [Verrucomicrobiota bacterium]